MSKLIIKTADGEKYNQQFGRYLELWVNDMNIEVVESDNSYTHYENLYQAIDTNNDDEVRRILKQNVNLNVKIHHTMYLDDYNDEGPTKVCFNCPSPYLEKAVENGNQEIIVALLEAGASTGDVASLTSDKPNLIEHMISEFGLDFARILHKYDAISKHDKIFNPTNLKIYAFLLSDGNPRLNSELDIYAEDPRDIGMWLSCPYHPFVTSALLKDKQSDMIAQIQNYNFESHQPHEFSESSKLLLEKMEFYSLLKQLLLKRAQIESDYLFKHKHNYKKRTHALANLTTDLFAAHFALLNSNLPNASEIFLQKCAEAI